MQSWSSMLRQSRDCGIALIVFAILIAGVDVYAILLRALASWLKSGLWAGFLFGIIGGSVAVAAANSKPYRLKLHIAAIACGAVALVFHVANAVLIAIGTSSEIILGLNSNSYLSYYSTSSDGSALNHTFLACLVVDIVECALALALMIIDAVLLASLCKGDISKLMEVRPNQRFQASVSPPPQTYAQGAPQRPDQMTNKHIQYV